MLEKARTEYAEQSAERKALKKKADRPRDIHIYYKLLDKPLPNKMRLDVKKNDETA